MLRVARPSPGRRQRGGHPRAAIISAVYGGQLAIVHDVDWMGCCVHRHS
jgi:hypothetical protein